MKNPCFDFNPVSKEEDDSIFWEHKSLNDILLNIELLGNDKNIVIGFKLKKREKRWIQLTHETIILNKKECELLTMRDITFQTE